MFKAMKIVVFFLALLTLPAILSAQQARYVDPETDLQNLPRGDGALSNGGDDAQIIRFRNWSAFFPVRQIEAGDYTLELPQAPMDWEDFRYQAAGESHDLDHFMLHNHVGGLLVIKDGEILLERYGLGNTEDSLWVSFSMSKSVTSMLLGAAIEDGYIHSIDEYVSDYLPRLKGSAYDQARIRDILQMASGAQWNEDYADPNSDVATYPGGDVVALFEFMGNKANVATPGEVFNYNTGETDLVGALVRAAIGNNLATYLEHKIWQPFGMEADANWATHGVGAGERGGCCINATLRDYGRLGLFAMGGGVLADGSRVLPENWMHDSTSPSPAYDGYGYLWWLEGEGVFRASGIFGQGIYINPANNLVVAVLSAWPVATGNPFEAHRNGLFRAVDDWLQ
jgi:CubicO group peptidase (beta-lactamase class C family)